MTPKKFLKLGGVVLVLIGILGLVGVLGPTADQSIFGGGWWFDNVQSWAFLLVGIVALAALYIFPAGAQKSLVVLVGIVALFLAVYNLFSTSFWGMNLERPADLILHLVVGIWALMAARGRSEPMMM